MSSYSASKHALFGYLSSLRQEYKKFGKNITISMGCPYAINTTMFQGFRTKLDMLIQVLDEKYVGERLVREFIAKKDLLNDFIRVLKQYISRYSMNINIAIFLV